MEATDFLVETERQHYSTRGLKSTLEKAFDGAPVTIHQKRPCLEAAAGLNSHDTNEAALVVRAATAPDALTW